MLLTSSQVSGIITGIIILSCSTALFLSGYVIQQRTVAQLRNAIKAAELYPSPKPHLPDRFRSATTELEDGTIVVVNSQAGAEAGAQEPLILEVKPEGQDAHKMIVGGVKQDELQVGPRLELEKELRQKMLQDDAMDVPERERNVKKLSDKNQLHPDPEADDQKPISRAERRRLIKEEIKRLSYDDQPVYYQRRLY
ncbi:hypothetical protein F5X68DRAFT_210985 [Plectosphaerella plurivora]|uniref:Uncharacterized protein n=1 Tax=Plectosphaerella plurivora TaxID=936078 RepID=A0A9P8V8Y9_9PEZI|nr:hypothetical protein F5X68DRAFT_210985 [Plectosphaerella plurivora]